MSAMTKKEAGTGTKCRAGLGGEIVDGKCKICGKEAKVCVRCQNCVPCHGTWASKPRPVSKPRKKFSTLVRVKEVHETHLLVTIPGDSRYTEIATGHIVNGSGIDGESRSGDEGILIIPEWYAEEMGLKALKSQIEESKKMAKDRQAEEKRANSENSATVEKSEKSEISKKPESKDEEFDDSDEEIDADDPPELDLDDAEGDDEDIVGSELERENE